MNEFDLRHGDNMDLLPLIPDCSIDSCVTDPPYEISFMGKHWDGQGIANSVEFWSKVLRVLKPGAHLLAFGGTRTYHRMVCAIEDAGFEIRDSIHWIYGSGFPKSLDVSKAIDKAAGAERQILNIRSQPDIRGGSFQNRQRNGKGGNVEIIDSVPASNAAKQWDGFGTALKPSHEPIVLARKPLSEKTVAANVLKWGTGALNVDGCRIEGEPTRGSGASMTGMFDMQNRRVGVPNIENASGRWPANVIFDEDAAAELDRQSGNCRSAGIYPVSSDWVGSNQVYGKGVGKTQGDLYEDEGGASRFFYVAKASTSERGNGNNHPTVKPVELMQYLCRLITPPGGTVLDPFTGSGSTGIAALREGFRFIGLEREAAYVEIAKGRIIDDSPLFNMETPLQENAR